MRVISGILRGRKIFTPSNDRIRPTLDRIREAIFNMVAFDIDEARVLDLFSGTGIMSIEALSRGAKRSFAVDNHIESISLIEKNVKTCNLDNKIEIIFSDYKDFLYKSGQKGLKFDIIIADPPYHEGISENLIFDIDKSGVWHRNSIIIIETDKSFDSVQRTEHLERIKDRTYSKTRVCVYKAESQETIL